MADTKPLHCPRCGEILTPYRGWTGKCWGCKHLFRITMFDLKKNHTMESCT